MATSGKKTRSTTRKKAKARQKAGSGLVPTQRKQEVLGLIMMVVALLLILAIVTYAPGDDPLAVTFEALLHPVNRAQNALGLIGAAIARTLVPNFLGYPVLLFPGLLFAWGYLLFRNRTPLYLPLISVLTSVGAVIISCLFGWFALVLETNLHLWSGTLGTGTAGWLDRVFGTAGSFILLLLVLAVTLLLLIDHDIQRSLDRAEELIRTLRTRIADAWAGLRNRQADRRAERAQLRAERRDALQEAREEREAQRDQRREATQRTKHRQAPALPSRQPTRHASNSRHQDRPEEAHRSTPPAPPPAPTPARNPAPPPTSEATPPWNTEEPNPLQLKVQARVEEEKTDILAHTADDVPENVPFEMPPLDLLDQAGEHDLQIDYDELEENKQILLDALATYNIEITDINAIVGPTVTLYELTPAPGVKISRITALEDDLAMAMAARGIRMIAPIPGKSAIGVEIPNRHRELVRIRDVIGTARFRDAQMELPLIVGKTIEGEVFLRDLVKMPHLLIAGATGAGKSVGLNTFIVGLLYACHPANLKFVMIDPKKIELQAYSRIHDHYIAMPPEAEKPIITDVAQALSTLQSCEREMEARYDLLSKARVRGIKDYNKKLLDGALDDDEAHRHLPYIVVIVDELADLMMTAGKEIEGPIARLAQMARAVGIHLILATQRPSVDVITGLIKANFPARVAYQVASKIDSRTILDQNGAQGLVGNGDLLYMLGSHMLRLQGPFVSIDEVDEITYFIEEQPGPGPYLLPSTEDAEDDFDGGGMLSASERDDLFSEAARIIVRSQQGSVSLLQRKLSVGYSRAARIVDQLEHAGIVGPFEGSKARQVLVADEFELDALLKTGANA